MAAPGPQVQGISHAYAKAADDARIAGLGATWVRLTPEYRPNGDYSAQRSELAAAHAAGLKVLVCGLGDFAGTGGHSLPLTDAQRVQYAGYVQAVAAGADAFEVWNEPNGSFFGGPHANATDAAKMAVTASNALDGIGFAGARLTAGLQDHGDLKRPDSTGWEPERFFHAELAVPGFVSSFTVLNSHAYAWSNGQTLATVDARYSAAKQLVDEWNEVHNLTGASPPIAWSEYGAPSASDLSVNCSGGPYGSLDFQRRSYEDAHTYWRNLAAYGVPEWGKFAHKDVDDPIDLHCGQPRNMGIDGRPAGDAFRAEAARVG